MCGLTHQNSIFLFVACIQAHLVCFYFCWYGSLLKFDRHWLINFPYLWHFCTGNEMLGMWIQVYALHHHNSYMYLGLFLTSLVVCCAHFGSVCFMEVWWSYVWGGKFVLPSVAAIATCIGNIHICYLKCKGKKWVYANLQIDGTYLLQVIMTWNWAQLPTFH